MANLISADFANNQLCILEYTTSDGEMLSFEDNAFDAEIVLHTYTDKGKIIFDKPITSIGDWAFYNCTSLTSVTIGDSVTSIGDGAFAGCENLTAFYGKFASADNRCLVVDGVLKSFAIGCGATEYTIPDSVTSIGELAFRCCSSLTSITIPESVTSIERNAFWDCKSLTSVTIGGGVTSIGEGAFHYCYSLKEVYCKSTTPPSGGASMFSNNASGRKIYVPTESVGAYKAAEGWSEYADSIVGYDF